MITIKLPNFFDDNLLNTLKMKMGIDRYTYGNYQDCKNQGIREILKGEGQDFDDINEIIPLDDHTLTYNNERIILYIRDVHNYGDYDLPKLHVAKCSTLKQMFEDNRKRRYVRTQNDTGIFTLNVINGNNINKFEAKLNVCKNCLATLKWDNYSPNWSEKQKNECVANFSIVRFFEKYPKSLLESNGYSNPNSPVNTYPSNWDEISNNYKASKNWICEQCGVNLINHKSLLETHHINGQQNENHYANLKALCVECHANQPMHHHLHNRRNNYINIQKIRDIRKQQGIN